MSNKSGRVAFIILNKLSCTIRLMWAVRPIKLSMFLVFTSKFTSSLWTGRSPTIFSTIYSSRSTAAFFRFPWLLRTRAECQAT